MGAGTAVCAAERFTGPATTTPCEHGPGLFLLESLWWRWQGGTLWLPALFRAARSYVLTVHHAAHCNWPRTSAIASTIVSFPGMTTIQRATSSMSIASLRFKALTLIAAAAIIGFWDEGEHRFRYEAEQFQAGPGIVFGFAGMISTGR